MNRSATILVLGILIAPALPAASAGHGQTSPTGQTVAFDHKTGNAWWVETVLSGADAGSVAAVEAQDEGGPWVELTKRSWGAWAASFHIEPGHEVRFRATFDDGSQVTSCWFTHPDGVESCGEDPTPPPGGTEASFDHRNGNAWWVQVNVDVGGAEPSRVQAMDTGGDWHELTLRHWGDWAGSFHLEPGHEVRFRAMVDGAWQTSCWFTHPAGEERCRDADPPPLDEPGELEAAFAPKASNAWWVEAYAIANSTITSVEARADGGDWHELTLRDWGTWAGSFHVPAGSEVTFRATNATGAVGTSEAFLWPNAVPAANPDAAWPQEGSYAFYSAVVSAAPGIFLEYDATFVHQGGRWLVGCTGEDVDPGGSQPFVAFDRHAPPTGPTDVGPGDTATVGTLARCQAGAYTLTVERAATELTHRDGDDVTVPTWYGADVPPCRCDNDEAEWETTTGLTVGWHNSGTSWEDGKLLDTDAPIG